MCDHPSISPCFFTSSRSAFYLFIYLFFLFYCFLFTFLLFFSSNMAWVCHVLVLLGLDKKGCIIFVAFCFLLVWLSMLKKVRNNKQKYKT